MHNVSLVITFQLGRRVHIAFPFRDCQLTLLNPTTTTTTMSAQRIDSALTRLVDYYLPPDDESHDEHHPAFPDAFHHARNTLETYTPELRRRHSGS